MNPTPETPATTTPAALSVAQLSDVLSYPARWHMLRELSGGELRSISELAAAGRTSYDSALGHLRRMRKVGVVVQGRGYLYQLHPRFVSTSGQPIIDFGLCVLRFDANK